MKRLSIINMGISMLALATCLYLAFGQEEDKTYKFGFVQNTQILTDYLGMREGRAIYEKEVGVYQRNLDTLQAELQQRIAGFQAEYESMTKTEQEMAAELISKYQQEVANYNNAMQQTLKAKDEQLTEAVLSQIDNYIVEYGESNGYDYIFGATSEGSLFYAAEAQDLTATVIEGLNNTYNGE
jgi:outer membrane protein